MGRPEVTVRDDMPTMGRLPLARTHGGPTRRGPPRCGSTHFETFPNDERRGF